MEKLKYGETVVLENEKEYVCYLDIEYNDNIYAYLISKSNPKEVLIAKEIIKKELDLEIINDDTLKEKLYKLIIRKMNGEK